ncbi:hypothetical protein [Neglectibacter sp. CSJ-5]|uniref:hypothetical protein n=1 Tax=Neglectibacter sp. CSJ-5 TaxID=3078043 RepID=UPI0037C631E6
MITEKYITDEHTVTWLSEMMSRRKISQSEYGDSGTSAISRSITVYAMPTC